MECYAQLCKWQLFIEKLMGFHNWIKTSFKLYLIKLSQLDDLNLTQLDPYELGWVGLGWFLELLLDWFDWGFLNLKEMGLISNLTPTVYNSHLKAPQPLDKDSPSLTLKANQMQRPNRDFKLEDPTRISWTRRRPTLKWKRWVWAHGKGLIISLSSLKKKNCFSTF